MLVELFNGDGTPVLDVDGNQVSALTDADGYYEFPVPPGDYRLGFVYGSGELTPGDGGDHAQTMTALPASSMSSQA